MSADEPSRLVALRLRPGRAFVGALEEIWAAGDAVLPVDPALPAPAVRLLLDALRPALLRDAGGQQPLAGGVDVAPGVAAVIATSGSGGPPKGVELTHAALAASASAGAARLGAGAGDRWLCCLPVHHIGGFAVLVRARLAGVPAIVHARFDPAAVGSADATLVSLVPTMLQRLLDAGVDLRRFRRILLGGAAAPPTLLGRARSAGARVMTTYGMTETCGGCVYDGLPLDGVDVAVGADGRIRLRGPVLMRGYRLQDRTTANALAGGWLVTGDLGRIGEDGRLDVLGRADRVVVTGGANVVAEHVEALLETHPQVAEAAVVGRADADWGERVVAVVVAADPADPPTLEVLRAHVAAAAPAYAAPRELVLAAALPRLATGKVDYAAVSTGRAAGHGVLGSPADPRRDLR